MAQDTIVSQGAREGERQSKVAGITLHNYENNTHTHTEVIPFEGEDGKCDIGNVFRQCMIHSIADLEVDDALGHLQPYKRKIVQEEN